MSIFPSRNQETPAAGGQTAKRRIHTVSPVMRAHKNGPVKDATDACPPARRPARGLRRPRPRTHGKLQGAMAPACAYPIAVRRIGIMPGRAGIHSGFQPVSFCRGPCRRFRRMHNYTVLLKQAASPPNVSKTRPSSLSLARLLISAMRALTAWASEKTKPSGRTSTAIEQRISGK